MKQSSMGQGSQQVIVAWQQKDLQQFAVAKQKQQALLSRHQRAASSADLQHRIKVHVKL
jgi:hypothetical protein